MTDAQAVTLARLADGRVGRARYLADRPELLDWRRRTLGELVALLSRGRAERFAAVRELLDDAGRLVAAPTVEADPEEPPEPARRTPTGIQRAAAAAIVSAWIDLARDLAVAAAGSAELATSSELVQELPAVAGERPPAEWGHAAVMLDQVRSALEENVSPRLALETAMLAWPEIAGR
jgi:hypothetical protein